RGGAVGPRRGGQRGGRDGAPPDGVADEARREVPELGGLLHLLPVHRRVRAGVLRLRGGFHGDRQGRPATKGSLFNRRGDCDILSHRSARAPSHPELQKTKSPGENPATATSQVENILPSNPAVVKVLEDQGRHGLETGDSVTFSRVRGLDGLLRADERYEVKVTGPHADSRRIQCNNQMHEVGQARRIRRAGLSSRATSAPILPDPSRGPGPSSASFLVCRGALPGHRGRRRAEAQVGAHFQEVEDEARTCPRAAGRTAASWARCTRGMFGSPSDKRHDHTYRQDVKRAVLHLGNLRHGADDIETGRRSNLIVWNTNDAYRNLGETRPWSTERM
ncbi:hypothetical protein THAOC_00284, partial [Thalassiosira oceanica]